MSPTQQCLRPVAGTMLRREHSSLPHEVTGIFTSHWSTSRLACVACALFVAGRSAPAQVATHSGIFTSRDAVLLSGATLGAAALTLFDVPIARAFSDSARRRQHPGFSSAAQRASHVTETALMATGASVYAVARLRGNRGTEDVALHTTESIASAALAIQVVRGVLGRARPYVADDTTASPDSDPYDFRPFRGFMSFKYRSFPSMHAMASFAAASALSQEMSERYTPHRRLISTVLYAGASLPTIGRLILDDHWASDIAMGVFIGVFAGHKVVTYSHDNPGNRVDRALLSNRVSANVTLSARGASFGLLPW